MKWLKQLLCKHSWTHKSVNNGYYDFEEWYECRCCGKQKEMDYKEKRNAR